MSHRISRRNLLQGTLGGVAVLSFPSLAQPAEDVISIGYFVPAEDQIRYPAKMSWIAPANMVGMCLEPLIRVAGENHLEYVLATKISSDPSGRIWSIDLRPDVVWQGGTIPEPLTAEHVAANIRHWMEDQDSALGHQLRDFVADVKVSSPRVFQVELKAPNFQFFYVFTSYAALIMHPADNWIFSTTSRRTGPFQMVSYEAMKEAKFIPAEVYWDTSHKAQLPVTFIQDNGAADQNFDLIPQLDPDRGPTILARGAKIKQNALADALVFHMNCREDLLRDVSIRQALRACLNPMGIVESIYGYGRASDHTHASSIHQDYPKGHKLLSGYQPEKAKALLAGRSVSLPLHYIADNVWQRNAVEAYALQAKDIGLTIVPTPVDHAKFDSDWDKLPGLTALKWVHRPLAMQLYREVYYSTAKWNLSAWNNEIFDGYVDKLHATPLENTAVIGEIMTRAMQLMHDEGPMIHAAWLDCNKAYNPSRLQMASVEVGSGGHIYANKLRRA